MEGVIKDSIDQIKRAILENEELNAIPEENKLLVKPHIDAIDLEWNAVKDLVDSIEKSQKQKNTDLYKILVHVQNAQSSASLLMSSLTAAQMKITNKIKGTFQKAVNNAVNWVGNQLIPWLQNLLSSVWGLIQNLIKPTGWKLSGELGTGIFGIAKAKVEISFG